jgi:hypothetical protein
MFCPNCGAEYVEEITECADCRVPLVAERPTAKEAERPEFEKILTIFNVGDIAVIKSVLDSAQIEYIFDGENFNLVDPMVQPARLFVRASQAAMARELLKEMNLHFWSLSPRDDTNNEEK